MKSLKTTLQIVTTALAVGILSPFSGAEDEEIIPVENVEYSYSFSLDAVYANAFKRATRGGVEMGGTDLRLNYNIDEGIQFSVGMLALFGNEDIGANEDLSTSNIGVLVGYRLTLPLVDDKLTAYAGVRGGISYVAYIIDTGYAHGWNHYMSDSDLCAVYAAEVGLSYNLSEQWSIRAGYEFYGNTAKIGGMATKFSEQQYHLLQLGVEYAF